MVPSRGRLRAGWLAGLLLVALPLRAGLLPLGELQQLSAGFYHACAVDRAGALYCWGRNQAGELGDGTRAQRDAAVRVAAGGEAYQQVSAGTELSCGLTRAGAVRCWGFAGSGLGDGVSTQSNTPVAVDLGGATAAAVAASHQSACALLGNGTVRCWGANGSGQLGNGDTLAQPLPVSVQGISTATAIAVGAGFDSSDPHACALLGDGGVRCWGGNASGQLGNGSLLPSSTPVAVQGLPGPAQAISLGIRVSCALVSTEVYCWGSNGDAQLGLTANSPARSTTAVRVDGLGGAVAALDAGAVHLCARRSDGGVRCWGNGFQGELGNDRYLFGQLPSHGIDAGAGFAAISAGASYSCGLRDGTAQCWGSAVYGTLGAGDASLVYAPRRLGLAGVGALGESGRYANCVLVAGGVRCWGPNNNGELGLGPNRDGSIERVPVAVPGFGSGNVAVASGEGMVCAIDGMGGLRCAGYAGQPFSDSPASLAAVNFAVAEVSIGRFHQCLRSDAGQVYCWGNNDRGQIGVGGRAFQNDPVQVGGLPTPIVSVAAGSDLAGDLANDSSAHSCAVGSNGTVACWGDNRAGQLGDGTTTLRETPVAVVMLPFAASRVIAGIAHTCALSAAGQVACWGDNSAGQLGDGSTTGSSTPVLVQGLPRPATDLAAGFRRSCALLDDGNVYCWGGGIDPSLDGVIGDGAVQGRLLPQKVAGIEGRALALNTGQSHSCALLDDGDVACWGVNQQGQVGVGGRNYGLPGSVLTDVARPLLVSPSAGGNGPTSAPVLDRSGRFAVFSSSASNLTGGPDGNNASDVFRVDLATGATLRVSVDDAEGEITGAAIEPSVSGDGNLVVFVAADAAVAKLAGEAKAARDLRRKGSGFAVFLRNIQTGRTMRVGAAAGPGAGTAPQIAPDGGSVVYTGETVGGEGVVGQENIFRVALPRVGGEPAPQPRQCLSCQAVDGNGAPQGNSDGASRNATLSEDGRWVAWESAAKNLLAGAPSPCPASQREVFLRNVQTGQTQRVSPPPGTPPSRCGVLGSGKPSLDGSGNRLVFESDIAASSDDRNGVEDIYLVDLAQTQTARLSRDPAAGLDGAARSLAPRLSADGRQVVFVSEAANIEGSEADDNATSDVLVLAIDEGKARRVSSNRRNEQNAGAALRPTISGDGGFVAFDSAAGNLLVDRDSGAALDGNGVSDVFRAVNPFRLPRELTVVFADGFEP
jgi:alpha-tubulin suppressor-like RCC1 family protein/Tol biopolymer transport system component